MALNTRYLGIREQNKSTILRYHLLANIFN